MVYKVYMVYAVYRVCTVYTFVYRVHIIKTYRWQHIFMALECFWICHPRVICHFFFKKLLWPLWSMLPQGFFQCQQPYMFSKNIHCAVSRDCGPPSSCHKTWLSCSKKCVSCGKKGHAYGKNCHSSGKKSISCGEKWTSCWQKCVYHGEGYIIGNMIMPPWPEVKE